MSKKWFRGVATNFAFKFFFGRKKAREKEEALGVACECENKAYARREEKAVSSCISDIN